MPRYDKVSEDHNRRLSRPLTLFVRVPRYGSDWFFLPGLVVSISHMTRPRKCLKRLLIAIPLFVLHPRSMAGDARVSK